METIRIYLDYRKIHNQMKGMTMQNWKTTVFGLIAGVAMALANYSGPNSWHGYVVAAALAAIGILAKDFNVNLSASELDAVKQLLNKAPLLLMVLALGSMLYAQTAPAPTPTAAPTTTVTFTGGSDVIALRFGGAWGTGNLTTESFDLMDFGAGKTEHLFIEGKELIGSQAGINAYFGGVKFQPDLSKVLAKTNVSPANFGLYVSASGGAGIPNTGGSHAAFMLGTGIEYRSSSALSWNPLQIQYVRIGNQNGAVISTGLSFIFGQK